MLGSEVLLQVTGGTRCRISSTLGASCSSHERSRATGPFTACTKITKPSLARVPAPTRRGRSLHWARGWLPAASSRADITHAPIGRSVSTGMQGMPQVGAAEQVAHHARPHRAADHPGQRPGHLVERLKQFQTACRLTQDVHENLPVEMLNRRPAALGRRASCELTRHDCVRPQRSSRTVRYTPSAPKGRPVVPPGPAPRAQPGDHPPDTPGGDGR